MYIKINEEQRILLLKAIDMLEGSENTSISCDRECRRLEDVLSLSDINSYDVVDLAKTATHGLIVVAPEMYNMLQTCRDFVASDTNCGPHGLGLICMIDDLLAKARGEK